MTTRSIRSIALVAGPVMAWAWAWGTSSVGDSPDELLTLANVALVLAAVTVAAAMVSWQAGLVTSVVAALSLNWFHTQPYGTLRITSGDDVTAVALLAALGICVSAVSAHRQRTAVRSGRAAAAIESQHTLLADATQERPALEFWHAAIGAVPGEIALLTAQAVDRPPAGIAHVARPLVDGPDPDEFPIPPTGAWIEMGHHPSGAVLVLRPRAGQSTLRIDRRVIVAFADTLGVAMSRA